MKKLAECLLRRKELQQKLDRMSLINRKDLFKTEVQRVRVAEGFDDIQVKMPVVKFADFDAEYNYYAKQLRLIDAAIQNMNWTTDVDNVSTCFDDFVVVE